MQIKVIVVALCLMSTGVYAQTINVYQIPTVSPDSPGGWSVGGSWETWVSNAFYLVDNHLYQYGGDRSTNHAAVIALEGFAEHSDCIVTGWDSSDYLWQGVYTSSPPAQADSGNMIRFIIVVTASNTTFRKSDVNFNITSRSGLFGDSGTLATLDIDQSVIRYISDFGADGVLGGGDDVYETRYPGNPMVGLVYVGIGYAVTLRGETPGQAIVDEATAWVAQQNVHITSIVTVDNGVTNDTSCAEVKLIDSLTYPPTNGIIWSVSPLTDGIQINVPSLPSVTYTIEETPTLSTNTIVWTDLGSWTGEGDFYKFRDQPGGPFHFYRLKREVIP